MRRPRPVWAAACIESAIGWPQGWRSLRQVAQQHDEARLVSALLDPQRRHPHRFVKSPVGRLPFAEIVVAQQSLGDSQFLGFDVTEFLEVEAVRTPVTL